MSLTASSQKLVLLSNDTLIGFSIPKSKFLLKQVYKYQECDSLLSIADKQLAIQEVELTYKDSLLVNGKYTVDLQQKRINDFIDEINRTNNRHKWTQIGFIASFSVSIVLLTIIFVK